MKKLLPVLVLGSLLAVLLSPAVALAQTAPVDFCNITDDRVGDMADCPGAGSSVGGTGSGADVISNAWGICCVMNAIYTVTNWIFIILIAIAAIMVLWGAVTIVTAGGAPEKVTTGRSLILYAMIGLAVALLARAFPSIVRALLGV